MMNKFFLSTRRAVASLAAAAVLVTMPLAGCNQSDDAKKEETNSKASETTSNYDDIVVKSKNYRIKYSVIEYLMNYMFLDFCNSNGTSYFDVTQDLRKQYYNEEEKISWYDYFYETTRNYITQIMVFAEGGKAQGLKLSDAELKQLDDSFNQMESVAAESSMTLDEFISKEYGSNVTRDDVEEIQKMTVLARNYDNYLYESFEYTDEEYEKKYAEDTNSYSVADFIAYSFKYSDEQTSGSVDKETAKENADALANAKNEDEFFEYLEKYLRDNPLEVYVPTTDESSVTEENFNAGVESALEAAKNNGVTYSDSNNCYKWIFDSGRKKNDITVIDENNAYNVILVTKPIYRSEEETRNIRHILINLGTEDDADAKAKEKAEKIYKEWGDGDKTEAAFAELANKYSEDPGSNTNGGLYENVSKGDMVEEFNDWMFDPNRKIGDNAIIKTDYGYHIMYYPGPGLTEWKVAVDSDLREDDLSAEYDKLKKEYEITFDDETIGNIEITIPESMISSAVSSQ